MTCAMIGTGSLLSTSVRRSSTQRRHVFEDGDHYLRFRLSVISNMIVTVMIGFFQRFSRREWR